VLVAIEEQATGPIIVVYVIDPAAPALRALPVEVEGLRVVIRQGMPGMLPKTVVLGDDPEPAGNDGVINTLGNALMIAAPLVIFGGLVYATTRDRRAPDLRRR
jgi:hypothetical protein